MCKSVPLSVSLPLAKVDAVSRQKKYIYCKRNWVCTSAALHTLQGPGPIAGGTWPRVSARDRRVSVLYFPGLVPKQNQIM